jgi:hypothetical protein
MLYQGVNIPLLKLDTIVEHGDGRVGTEEESEATVKNGQDSDSSESEDLVESEKDKDDKHEGKKKVLQNGKTGDDCMYNWCNGHS